MARPLVYPKGSRVSFNARINREAKEIIDDNLEALNYTSFTEWLDVQMLMYIEKNKLKKKDRA